jgi:hypothetical protein
MCFPFSFPFGFFFENDQAKRKMTSETKAETKKGVSPFLEGVNPFLEAERLDASTDPEEVSKYNKRLAKDFANGFAAAPDKVVFLEKLTTLLVHSLFNTTTLKEDANRKKRGMWKIKLDGWKDILNVMHSLVDIHFFPNPSLKDTEFLPENVQKAILQLSKPKENLTDQFVCLTFILPELAEKRDLSSLSFVVYLTSSKTFGKEKNALKQCFTCKGLESQATSSLKACSKCHDALYCSKICQKLHWNQGHSKHCHQ